MEKINIYKWEFIFEYDSGSGNWTLKEPITKAIEMSGYEHNGILRFERSSERVHYFEMDLRKKIQKAFKRI